MLAALALLFAVVWVMALVVLETASIVVHLLLILAVLAMIAHLVRGITSPHEAEPLI